MGRRVVRVLIKVCRRYKERDVVGAVCPWFSLVLFISSSILVLC
jgi:hypothetical protein